MALVYTFHTMNDNNFPALPQMLLQDVSNRNALKDLQVNYLQMYFYHVKDSQLQS